MAHQFQAKSILDLNESIENIQGIKGLRSSDTMFNHHNNHDLSQEQFSNSHENESSETTTLETSTSNLITN